MKPIMMFFIAMFTFVSNYGQTITFGKCDENLAANLANPYDHIGKSHNQELQILLNNSTMNDLRDANYLHKQSISYVSANAGDDAANTFASSFTNTTTSTYLSGITGEEMDANYFTDNLNVSDEAKEALKSLITTIYNEKVANSGYENIKTLVVDFEAKIESLNLSKEEKVGIYAYTSTLRYSLLLWQNSSFASANQKMTAKKVRWWMVLCTVLFDAGGAVLGTMAGGPVGGVAGGAIMSGGAAAVFSTFD